MLLASQYLSQFKTWEMDFTEPLLTWFIHKVPNVTAKEVESIGLSVIGASMADRVKTQDVHQCLQDARRARPLHARHTFLCSEAGEGAGAALARAFRSRVRRVRCGIISRLASPSGTSSVASGLARGVNEFVD